MTIRITGTGSALPEKIVTNFELQNLVETSDEWIRERTGIAERRISTGEIGRASCRERVSCDV